MANKKIVVNKHYRDASSITEDIFSRLTSGGVLFREGEVVLCNDGAEPGIYMFTESASTENPGKVVKINSAEYVTRPEDDKTVEESLVNLQEQINNIPTASTIGIESTRVETHTEPFIGDDGKSHPAGKYLVMVFKNTSSGTTTTYNEVSGLFVEDWYGTEAEYNELVEREEIDPNKTYFTYEDE